MDRSSLQEPVSHLSDQDDVLGRPVAADSELPRYPEILTAEQELRQTHFRVVQAALQDRQQYDNAIDSLYYTPRSDLQSRTAESLLTDYVAQRRRPDLSNWIVQQQKLIHAFFFAIDRGLWEMTKLVLNSDLIDANFSAPQYREGCTPLMVAVKSKHKNICILLLEHGAFLDGWCVVPEGRTAVARTPLMIAASQGDLPTVKWLMEGYGADDSLIAPDGQIALRLAADAGHQHVVAYLPTRRGGMYLRWKTRQMKIVLKLRQMAVTFGQAMKAVFYHCPKWLIYHLLLYPIRDGVRWCWRNKQHFFPFIRRQIGLIPERLMNTVHCIHTWVKELPKNIAEAAQKTWQAIEDFFKGLWNTIKQIPAALRIVWAYIRTSARTVWTAVNATFDRALALLHTTITAIVTFFRSLTLANLWAAFVDLFEAIFVTLPVKIWHVLKRAQNMIGDVIEHFFGCLIRLLVFVLWEMIKFPPKQFARVVAALGEMLAASWKEIKVWWNPKAM